MRCALKHSCCLDKPMRNVPFSQMYRIDQQWCLKSFFIIKRSVRAPREGILQRSTSTKCLIRGRLVHILRDAFGGTVSLFQSRRSSFSRWMPTSLSSGKRAAKYIWKEAQTLSNASASLLLSVPGVKINPVEISWCSQRSAWWGFRRTHSLSSPRTHSRDGSVDKCRSRTVIRGESPY